MTTRALIRRLDSISGRPVTGTDILRRCPPLAGISDGFGALGRRSTIEGEAKRRRADSRIFRSAISAFGLFPAIAKVNEGPNDADCRQVERDDDRNAQIGQ